MTRIALTCAQGLATVVLLALVARDLDWAAFRAVVLRLPAWFYLASFLGVLAGQVVYAWKWQVLLAAGGVSLPFGTVLRQYFVGLFLSNFLPSTIGGDVAKVYYLGHEHGYRTVVASIVIDRGLGIGLAAALAASILWALPVRSGPYDAARVAVALVAAAAAVLALLVWSRRGEAIRRLPARGAWLGALVERFHRLGAELARMLRSPAVWVSSCLAVALYFTMMALIYAGFIDVLAGPVPPFLALMAVAASTAVLTNIPITLNGVGLREQLTVLLLEPLGVPAEAALALSLLVFAHLLAASLIGGIAWIPLRRGASFERGA